MLRALFTLAIVASMQSSGDVPVDATHNINIPEAKAAITQALPVPHKDPKYIAPVIYPKGVIAIDMDTRTVLFEKNPDEQLPIASLTKLMTALIIMEEEQLNSEVTISPNAAYEAGSQAYLQVGETYNVRDLLLALLIPSGNDAAVALAEFNAESEENFVKKMNDRALKMGLRNTHFANPNGLDHPDNYSSARDVSIISRKLLQYDFIREVVKLRQRDITTINGEHSHTLYSTNQILGGYLNVKGLKTGKTLAAGECLSTIADGPDGHEVLTIVIGSSDRFTETKILLDWIYRAYTW